MDYDNLTIEELFEEFKKQYYKLSEIASDSLNTSNASVIHSDVMDTKDLNSYADEVFMTSQQTDELIKFKEIANSLDNRLTPTKNGTSFTENFIIEHNQFGFHKTDIKDWDNFSAKAPDDISGINDDIDEANRLRREAEEEITGILDEIDEALDEEIIENPDGSITRKGPGYEYRENVPLEEFAGITSNPYDYKLPKAFDDIAQSGPYQRAQIMLTSVEKEILSGKFRELVLNQYDMFYEFAKDLPADEQIALLEAQNNRVLMLQERPAINSDRRDLFKIVVTPDQDLSLEELDLINAQIQDDLENYPKELQKTLDDYSASKIISDNDIADLGLDEDDLADGDAMTERFLDEGDEVDKAARELDELELARELGIVEEGPMDTSNLSDDAKDKLDNLADDETKAQFYDMNDIEEFANGNTRITPEQARELQEMTGIFQNKADEIANKLPLETVVRNKLSKKLSEMTVRWTTFSGAGELLDIYETAVLLFYGLVAAKPELEKLATNYMIDMYNIMAEPYGAKINRDEYTPDWKYINEQLENAERITPTDIIIKKTGELIEGVAETGMVTGFGYVPTTADKLTKTIKSPSPEEEKVEDPMYDRIRRTFSGKFTK